MYCLRGFDLKAAFAAPSLFRLYGEIPYAIDQDYSVEQQVCAHIENSNYGHQGNEYTSRIYQWSDLSPKINSDVRFEHELTHLVLDVVAQQEGWGPFFADGNHKAESYVIAMEPLFQFWEIENPNDPKILKRYNDDVYAQEVACWYNGVCDDDQFSFLLGWEAANHSERPVTAFEARFFGLLPHKKLSDINPEVGERNKWGEGVPSFDGYIDLEKAKVFYHKAIALRAKMLDTVDQTGFNKNNRDMWQAFFKTLKVSEIAQITSGEAFEGTLTYDIPRVKTAYLSAKGVAPQQPALTRI